MTKKGLSLLEILISLILLSLVITGLFNNFIAGRKYILHARARVAAVEMARVFLDYLQGYVRTDDWNTAASNPLTEGDYYCDGVGGHAQIAGCPSAADRTLDNDPSSATSNANVTYSAAYHITTFYSTLRRIVLTVTWNESAQY